MTVTRNLSLKWKQNWKMCSHRGSHVVHATPGDKYRRYSYPCPANKKTKTWKTLAPSITYIVSMKKFPFHYNQKRILIKKLLLFSQNFFLLEYPLSRTGFLVVNLRKKPGRGQFNYFLSNSLSSSILQQSRQAPTTIPCPAVRDT